MRFDRVGEEERLAEPDETLVGVDEDVHEARKLVQAQRVDARDLHRLPFRAVHDVAVCVTARVHGVPFGVTMEAVHEFLREALLPRLVEPLVDAPDQRAKRQSSRRLGKADANEPVDMLDVRATLVEERGHLSTARGRPVAAVQLARRECVDQVDRVQ